MSAATPWIMERVPGVAPGRSSATSFGPFAWAVAVGADPKAPTREQAVSTFAELDRLLSVCKTNRSKLLSVSVYLADLAEKKQFDEVWSDWIGPDASSWPQRACLQAGLEAGYRVELVALAARS